MKRLIIASLVVVACTAAPGHAGQSIRAVFAGDPVDGTSGQPHEIQPGRLLVRPGADGRLGSADDIVEPGIIGDIDLVVRSGAVSVSSDIPAPALSGDRTVLPAGVAGPANAGGTAIPFTVVISDGITTAAAPAGHLLPAADMNGLPVIVAAFADLDGDGWIGPTTHDRAGAADLHIEVRELEPVGRAAALFSDGVARGSIAVRAGLPSSQGGLTVALAALALTGPLDPNFFEGAIPSGPGITTALPFLPQRDLNRLIRDRPSPAGPDTSLQQLIEFAAIPAPDEYALPLDGSSPTIDGAVVVSQPAVRVSVHVSGNAGDSTPQLQRAVLGTRVPANLMRWRLLPVDRFDNPADPPPGFAVLVDADPALHVLGQRGPGRERPLRITSAFGRRLLGRLVAGTADGAQGTLQLERDGVVVAAVEYRVDARADRPRADVIARSTTGPALQSVIDTATDRNGDGVIAVGVRAGLYRDNLVVARSLELIGDGPDRTLLQGDGSADVLAASAAGVAVRGVTAVGGTGGFRLSGSDGLLFDSAAWRNAASGVALSAAGGVVLDSIADDNGGSGVVIGGTSAICARSELRDNQGAGVQVNSAADVTLRDNTAIENAGGGFLFNQAEAPVIESNRSAVNVGSGAELQRSAGAQLLANLFTGNDEDGVSIDRSDDLLVTGNTFESNNGYGLFYRRSAGGDFGAGAGLQPPLGDNSATNNRKGDLFVRED